MKNTSPIERALSVFSKGGHWFVQDIPFVRAQPPQSWDSFSILLDSTQLWKATELQRTPWPTGFWFGLVNKRHWEIREQKSNEIRSLFPAPSKQRQQGLADSLYWRSSSWQVNHSLPLPPQTWGGKKALTQTSLGFSTSSCCFPLSLAPIFVNACFLLNSSNYPLPVCHLFPDWYTGEPKIICKNRMRCDNEPRSWEPSRKRYLQKNNLQNLFPRCQLHSGLHFIFFIF